MTPALQAAHEVLPVLSEDADRVDRTATFPVRALETLRGSGLLGLLVPAEYGGMAGDLADMVAVARLLASECTSTAMIWAMHCQQVDALVRHGSPKLRAELLPQVAAGRRYLASVTTEPGTGGHLLSSVAALREDDAMLIVERTAPIVTGGGHADGFLITMRESEQSNERDVTLVYAERGQLTLEELSPWDSLGMRGTESVGMRLSGTVPPHHILGEPGGFRVVAVDSMIPAGHLAWAACWLGTAHAALTDVLGLLRAADRRPVDTPTRSELAYERIARARIDVELVSVYLGGVTAEILDARERRESLDRPSTQIHINNLKVIAAERTFESVDRLVRIAGLANGYLKGARIPLERRFRDLRSASLNYADDRLLAMTGALCLLDRAATLPWDVTKGRQ